MKLSKLAAAMPFAHLLGMPAPAARAQAEDDDKKRDDESDEDYAKRMEDKKKEDEAKAKKATEQKDKEDAARADDDDADMEDEKDDKEDGKRAGRAKGARQRERIRCAHILAAGVKLGLVKQACSMAFDTKMSAAQSIGLLQSSASDLADLNSSAALAAPVVEQPRLRNVSLDERMARAPKPNPGIDAGQGAQLSVADQIIAAGKLRRGEK